MKNILTNFNKGLSIQELEERHELSVAVAADAMEAAKDDDCIPTRCDNCGC